MSANIKNDIIEAISKTDDQNIKVVLMLLLGVLDAIGGKIDAMRADEVGLRDAVLNGHAVNHDKHHEWVELRMIQELEEAKANMESKRKIRDGLIEKFLWIALVAAAGSSGWLLK